MKSKHLFLMLLLAFALPWAAMAQGTLPIGNGTSYSTSGSSATGSGSAMGNCYNYYSTSQFIYTADELGGAMTINSIAFNHNASSMSSTVNIYLAHTTATTVDVSNPATAGTLVSTLSESTIGGSPAGWQTFNFSTPFEYNGTDNLLVIVSRSKYNSGWSNSLGWQYTATSDNKFMTRNSDGSGYDNITNTSYSYTAYANRPNVIIGYVLTTPYVTLAPASETVNIGSTQTLTATVGNVTGTPSITYSSSNNDIATVSGNGTTATVTGVAPGIVTITATMNVGGTNYTGTSTITVATPTITLPATETVSLGYTKTLTATIGNLDNTPDVTYKSSNTSVATVSGNGTTATVSGIALGTATITAAMTVAGTEYSATCAITVEEPSYCTPSFSYPEDDYIKKFATTGGITNINNTSSYGTGGYSNYYDSQSASIEAGKTLTCTVTPSSTQWSYGHAIWVDWNNDYEFAENEKVAYTSSYASGDWTGSFEVPSTIAAGDYHMRVIHAYNQTVTNPCMTNNEYGEAEDYKLTVVPYNPCGAPTNLTETQVGTTTAVLNWEGENDSYVLQYRTAAYDMNMNVWQQQGDDIEAPGTFTQLSFDLSAYSGTGYIAIRHYACSGQWQMTIDDILVTNANNETVFEEDFEDGSIPTTITNLDYDGDGYSWQIANFGTDATCQNGGYCVMSASYMSYVGDLYPDNWLIIPDVELGGTLTFYVASTDAGWPENFGVFVATQSYEGAEAGEWSADIPVATTSKKLTGLTASTAYDWQVKGICGTEPSNWASSSFTTIAEGFKTFVTAGNWDVADNWFPEGVPAITDEVSITKAANIPAGVVAQAKKATIETGGSITIKDGGQLKQGSATLKVTMEKEITGYGESTNKDHYYFIATPLTGSTAIGYNSAWNYVYNLNDGDYDFYAFDASEVTEEWQNYEAYSFYMYPGEGYLYANKADKTLQFIGTVKGTNNPTTIDYTYDGESTDPFNGWALVGNPYTCNTYINYVNGETVLDADFYTLNATGSGYVLAESSVALPPLTGAFINYAATGAVQFTTEAPTGAKAGMLNMTLSQGRGSIDQARVRFGQGYNMKHMSFRNNSSIYMPVGGDDCAVAYTENQGEMPVNFKAENNGSYTLSFNTENVEFGYLHLIDNMTGEDVNLLETPSYSFEAKTTDYASRFKLVFSANSTVSEESFAFMSDGNLIVNNEGNATLQVIDINGRILRSENINGSANIDVNAAPGVYMIRLVNGENVRTQKIVVK